MGFMLLYYQPALYCNVAHPHDRVRWRRAGRAAGRPHAASDRGAFAIMPVHKADVRSEIEGWSRRCT
jgi:hypothetical protein